MKKILLIIPLTHFVLNSCVVVDEAGITPATSPLPQTPAFQEEKPSTDPVPAKVISDCLAALRLQVGNDVGMKVINARRGETSFIIDVKVDSAQKTWRCFHDGTKCTGTEYQGEG